MIKECNNSKNSIDVEEYIREEYYKALYMYVDLRKYGFEDENIKCWIQEKNTRIIAVILKYYTGMHIFSKGELNAEEIAQLIKKEKPSVICGEDSIIKNISTYLKTEYNEEYGWVRELEEIEYYEDKEVLKAEKKDFKQIAKLLFEDEDIGSSYELDILEKQMIERNKQNFSSNYVIKNNNGEVIAHAGTGAEEEKLAILNYVITHPKYRGKGFAKRICKAVCSELIKQGKKVYLINYSNESTALYDKIGFKICCKWGKLLKK